MHRPIFAGAILGLVAVLATPAVGDDAVTYGLFRTRAQYIPIEQRNCWIQAQISGNTINGELISANATLNQTQCDLHTEIVSGRCVNQVDEDVATGC